MEIITGNMVHNNDWHFIYTLASPRSSNHRSQHRKDRDHESLSDQQVDQHVKTKKALFIDTIYSYVREIASAEKNHHNSMLSRLRAS